MVVAMITQAEPGIVHELSRLATAQTVVAIAVAVIALSAFLVAVGALLAVRKLIGTVDRAVGQITPKLDPLLRSASKIGEDAEEVSNNVKARVSNVLDTVDDINDRLKSGTKAVEHRVRKFGAVVEVVQSEAEELLLDAASAAHGVHTAAEVMRSDKRDRLRQAADDPAEDLFTD
jgi:hypothetical protein